MALHKLLFIPLTIGSIYAKRPDSPEHAARTQPVIRRPSAPERSPVNVHIHYAYCNQLEAYLNVRQASPLIMRHRLSPSTVEHVVTSLHPANDGSVHTRLHVDIEGETVYDRSVRLVPERGRIPDIMLAIIDRQVMGTPQDIFDVPAFEPRVENTSRLIFANGLESAMSVIFCADSGASEPIVAEPASVIDQAVPLEERVHAMVLEYSGNPPAYATSARSLSSTYVCFVTRLSDRAPFFFFYPNSVVAAEHSVIQDHLLP